MTGIEALRAAKAWLDGIHQGLFPTLIVVKLWSGQWLVRKFAPGFWESIANILPLGRGMSALDTGMRKAWQAIPSLVGGALVMGMATGSVMEAVVGALIGALAPVTHETLKALPVPYRGATKMKP